MPIEPTGGVLPGTRDPYDPTGGYQQPVQQSPVGSSSGGSQPYDPTQLGTTPTGIDPTSGNALGPDSMWATGSPYGDYTIPGMSQGTINSIVDPSAAGRGFNTGSNPGFEAQYNQFGGMYLPVQPAGRYNPYADYRGNALNVAAGMFGNDPFELFGEAAAAGLALNTSNTLANQQNAMLNLAQQNANTAAGNVLNSNVNPAFNNLMGRAMQSQFSPELEAQQQAAAKRRIMQGGQAAMGSALAGNAAMGMGGGETAGLTGGLANQQNLDIANTEAGIANQFAQGRAAEVQGNLNAMANAAPSFLASNFEPLNQANRLLIERGFNPTAGTAALIEGLWQAEGFKQSKEAGFAMQGGVFEDIMAGTNAVANLLGAFG